ncbi:tail protein X [Alphaproteobacteria bacterium]|nr:tail protein X [Alphaproteobacteria bacterium]
MVVYVTKDNDVLDHICWKYYGTSDAVHQVLQANPHLVKFDYVLPRGVQIKLPVLERQQINREVRLWD